MPKITLENLLDSLTDTESDSGSINSGSRNYKPTRDFDELSFGSLSSDRSGHPLERSNNTALVVGDIHFKDKNMQEGEEFSKRLLDIATKTLPSFIVILGDTLDTHETVKVAPFKLACNLIEELSKIAHLYLIIGNHDYINNQQFLTDNHIFSPLKKWKNVTVVDKIITSNHDDKQFVFCPYVPPGRFMEALNTLTSEGETWDTADCIFAHQEFYNCQLGAIVSTDGDKWDDSFPPVISGHIHNEQKVGGNIYYTGSSIQHAFGESPDKRIWNVNFCEKSDGNHFSVEKLDLKMKGKKMVYLNVEDVSKFMKTDSGVTQLMKYKIKMSLEGTSEQFKLFRSSKIYKDLVAQGVKFSYQRLAKDGADIGRKTRKETSFLSVLQDVVSKRDTVVQKAYLDHVDSSIDFAEKERSRKELEARLEKAREDELALIEKAREDELVSIEKVREESIEKPELTLEQEQVVKFDTSSEGTKSLDNIEFGDSETEEIGGSDTIEIGNSGSEEFGDSVSSDPDSLDMETRLDDYTESDSSSELET